MGGCSILRPWQHQQGSEKKNKSLDQAGFAHVRCQNAAGDGCHAGISQTFDLQDCTERCRTQLELALKIRHDHATAFTKIIEAVAK